MLGVRGGSQSLCKELGVGARVYTAGARVYVNSYRVEPESMLQEPESMLVL